MYHSRKRTLTEDMLLSVLVGLAGFVLCIFQFRPLPDFFLLLGSAIVITFAVRRGRSYIGRHSQPINTGAQRSAHEAIEGANDVTALNKLGEELSHTFDLQSICRAAHRYIETQVEASAFVISLFNPVEEAIRPIYGWGDGNEYEASLFPVVKLGQGAHSRCILSKGPVVVEDVESTRPYKTAHFVGIENDPRKPQSMLYLPLISFDKVVGTLQVQSYSKAQFQPQDVDRLFSVASQIAVSINNSSLFAQLKHAKAEWEKTFDSMSDGVFVFDSEARLIRVNRAGAEMEGLEIKWLLGRRCCDLLAVGGREQCFVQNVIKNRERTVKEVCTRRDERTLLITVEPVDVDGRSTGAVCVAHDITKLRGAEAEARAQREFAAQLVENAQEAIYTFDVDCRITWFNRRLCDTTGFSAGEIERFDIRRLVHVDDLESVRECALRVFRGTDDSCKARFVKKDGEVRWFNTTFTGVRSAGEIKSVLAITRDVTEERASAEQMERANKLAAVGQLAAGVAHDFNNLLVPILGRAQLLKRQLKDESALRGLDVIEKAALDGAVTVRRLQNFSRRTNEPEMETVDVDEILRDVVELTRTRWRDDALARGIKYEINLNFGGGATVLGSPSGLREVFTNLIINSLDAMPEGGRLSLMSRTIDSQLRLEIADTGTGMTAEVCNRIFEPFFSTKGHAGTGLGLAVSYGIIERHSGSIDVESSPGHGSRFVITLPLTMKKVEDSAERSVPGQTPVRILVVDDEELVRLTLVEVLEHMGHDVISAAGGHEGLRYLKETSVDLVLTDLSMPEMDGWTFARDIRKYYPKIGIVMVTGYAATIDLSGESGTMIDEVVGKPFDFDKLADVIEKLTMSRLSREVA
jgi:PAS domain S-box-containing protein